MSELDSFIHRKVVILPQEASVHQAARAMCERNVGCVLVSSSQTSVIGIVTDRDVACALSVLPAEGDLPLLEIMMPEPICADANSSLASIIKLMSENGVRRIPILEQSPRKHEKRCVGIITLDDLIASKSISIDELASVIQAQIKKKWVTHAQALRTAKAEARSEAHTEQTLNHFYKVIAIRTQLPSDLLQEVTEILLRSLVKRLHYNTSAHFITQLPHGLQEDLFDLPAGPDRAITASSIQETLTLKHQFPAAQALFVMRHFYQALTELLPEAEIENISAQLPMDMKRLFSEEKSAA